MSVFTRPVVAFRVPLNPPTPAIVQLGSASVGRNALLAIVTPFISQMQFCPLLLLRHRISAWPSPSKSPMPATTHAGSATGVIATEVIGGAELVWAATGKAAATRNARAVARIAAVARLRTT